MYIKIYVLEYQAASTSSAGIPATAHNATTKMRIVLYENKEESRKHETQKSDITSVEVFATSILRLRKET